MRIINPYTLPKLYKKYRELQDVRYMLRTYEREDYAHLETTLETIINLMIGECAEIFSDQTGEPLENSALHIKELLRRYYENHLSIYKCNSVYVLHYYDEVSNTYVYRDGTDKRCLNARDAHFPAAPLLYKFAK